MKKIFCVLLCIIMLSLSFCGCSEKKVSEDKINIVTTVFPPFDFARTIAGDKADITMLISPGSESHTFEPTPAHMKKAEECDIFIALGGESESWAERITESSKNEERVTVILSDTVTLLESHSGEEHTEHSHTHSHEHDEHIWTSPLNAVKMSRAIYDALCLKDPENADYYSENLKAFEEELMSLDADFRKTVKEGSKKELIFADRFPFLYLLKEYSLEFKAAFPGCAQETEPDINTLIELIEHIKENNIKVVFYTEFSSQNIADMMVRETGAAKKMLHSCHNVTKQEMKRGESYITLMRKNLENIKIALK